MTNTPNDVMAGKQQAEMLNELMERHPRRFSREEKENFIRDVEKTLAACGCPKKNIKEQRFRGLINSRNLIIGDESTAEFIITAHYDTPGRNGFLLGSTPILGQCGANALLMLVSLLLIAAEIMLLHALPAAPVGNVTGLVFSILIPLAYFCVLFIPMIVKNDNNKNDNSSGVKAALLFSLLMSADEGLQGRCCVALFDNEEWGIVGSSQFAGARKSRRKRRGGGEDDAMLVNLDCVGVGDILTAVSAERMSRRQLDMLELLRRRGLETSVKRSLFVYMSDHANFSNAMMLCYMRKSKIGSPYIPNIHSKKDAECCDEQVYELSAKLAEVFLEMPDKGASR